MFQNVVKKIAILESRADFRFHKTLGPPGCHPWKCCSFPSLWFQVLGQGSQAPTSRGPWRAPLTSCPDAPPTSGWASTWSRRGRRCLASPMHLAGPISDQGFPISNWWNSIQPKGLGWKQGQGISYLGSTRVPESVMSNDPKERFGAPPKNNIKPQQTFPITAFCFVVAPFGAFRL